MANLYQASLSKAGINTAGPQLYWQLRTGASNRARIFEVGISIGSAPTTAPVFQLSRATASLGTASTSQVGLPLDGADASGVSTLESAWSVAPTINTSYHRSLGLPVTAGGGFIWTWPESSPLVLGVSNALQITNANASGATTGTFYAYVVWEE
jgi:hypothetical protein